MLSQAGLVSPSSSATLGELFKECPGKLLEHLEGNLLKVPSLNPGPSTEMGTLDVMPVFPCAISLVDLNQFFALMECEIFSNYVNLFLNLPLFSRRMTYKIGVKQFSLDPPLKRRRFRIDHGMITAWVIAFRLPYFMKSHLYLEYRFSFDLVQDLHFDGKSLHLFHELKTPVGINRFRIFLNSRDMAKLVSFWMDCEGFYLLSDDKSRKEAFNALEVLYLKEGSRFELPEVLRKSILEKVEKEQDSSMVDVLVHSVPLIERIKKKEVERIKNFEEIARLLKTAQNEVMKFLRNYWIPRYFIRHGSPYVDSMMAEEAKMKSYLTWGSQHRTVSNGPIKVVDFRGQAPTDFEGVGDDMIIPQTGELAARSSIWNVDFTKKVANSKRKERKHLKKFTLFEQARKRSVAVNHGKNSDAFMKDLSNYIHPGNRHDGRLSSCTLGASFNRAPSEHYGSMSTVTARQSMCMQAVELKLPTLANTTSKESEEDLPDAEVTAIGVLPFIAIPEEETGKAPLLLLPSLSRAPSSQLRDGSNITKTSSNTTCGATVVLPALTTDQAHEPIENSNSEKDCSRTDPYTLLEKVNPELSRNVSVEQMNTRKWILGALASNALAGKPIKNYLTHYCSQVGVNKGPSGSVALAINNLDCWERIERIRATSGVSYGGRRADEITNAGGWGGLGACKLLPTYHYYLASLSGKLFEAHLEPVKDTRFISKHYLKDPEKLGMSEEVMNILRDNLNSQTVDDSWFALLQEHNLTKLKEHIMRYFVWEDERLLLNCAPSKEQCRMRVVLKSKSVSSIEHDAFGSGMEQDLTNQYIFSPRSDEVWLSLFALEVCSYRPAEVYFPPMPTTTKSVACVCTEESIRSGRFDLKKGEKSKRAKSGLMTESQANLPPLKDCRKLSGGAGGGKKRFPKDKMPLIKKIMSSASNSQMSISSSSFSVRDKKVKMYPATFKQVLSDPNYFGMFMKYLELNTAEQSETPLITFWHQVEIMKSYKNPKSRKDKAFALHKKYLYTGPNAPKRDFLKANSEACPALIEIAERKNITANMMITAQTYVCKLIEEKWWPAYKIFLDDEASARLILSSIDVTNTNINFGRDYRASIRYLWGLFTFDLINFQHGLQNKKVYSQFKNYLKRTAVKLRNTKGRKLKDGAVFTVVNGITLLADRLESDLDFFTEIGKWISLKCDMGQGSKTKLTKCSEALLTAKAQAIIACYLQSAIPPKVRVNLSQNIISEIEKRTNDNRKFYRGLFYNAALHMVALLLPFWKKFCFVLSARTSSNNLLMIQTMSGNSISIESFEETTVAKEDSSEEKHFEKLGQIVQGRFKRLVEGGKVTAIRGIQGRLIQQDKVLGRRDAFQAPVDKTEICFETLVCQFSLSSGICHVKHESGLEVPIPCETFITPHYERVEYLLSPLPQFKTISKEILPPVVLPKQHQPNNHATRRNRAAPSRAVKMG